MFGLTSALSEVEPPVSLLSCTINLCGGKGRLQLISSLLFCPQPTTRSPAPHGALVPTGPFLAPPSRHLVPQGVLVEGGFPVLSPVLGGTSAPKTSPKFSMVNSTIMAGIKLLRCLWQHHHRAHPCPNTLSFSLSKTINTLNNVFQMSISEGVLAAPSCEPLTQPGLQQCTPSRLPGLLSNYVKCSPDLVPIIVFLWHD